MEYNVNITFSEENGETISKDVVFTIPNVSERDFPLVFTVEDRYFSAVDDLSYERADYRHPQNLEFRSYNGRLYHKLSHNEKENAIDKINDVVRGGFDYDLYLASGGKYLYSQKSVLEKAVYLLEDRFCYMVWFEGSLWTVEFYEPYIKMDDFNKQITIEPRSNWSGSNADRFFRMDEIDELRRIYPDLKKFSMDALDSVHVFRPDLLKTKLNYKFAGNGEYVYNRNSNISTWDRSSGVGKMFDICFWDGRGHRCCYRTDGGKDKALAEFFQEHPDICFKQIYQVSEVGPTDMR